MKAPHLVAPLLAAPWLVAAVALAAAACAASSSEPGVDTTRRVALGAPFFLAIGETVAVEGTAAAVRFGALLEDSRCPRGVVCVQAGRARVQLEVVTGGTAVSLELSTQPAAAGVAGGLEVELRDVTPGPVAGRETPAADVRAELVARRAGAG